jgi:hypothetical protein
MTTTERERLVRETRWRIRRADARRRLEDGLKQMSNEQLNGSLQRMIESGNSDASCTLFYLDWVRLQGRA